MKKWKQPINENKVVVGNKVIEVLRLQYKKENCWEEAHYLLKCEEELKEGDFVQLREKGVFLRGQETGVLCHSHKDDGFYFYRLRSICDSGD